MNATTKKRVPFVLVVILAILLASLMGYTIADGVANAAATLAPESGMKPLSVGHMSDIHYFPLEWCYRDVHADDYYKSDFYDSMTGDTKLVLESGMILNAHVKQIIQDAKDGIAPQYIIASGDLSKNGEHSALIDVANSMRYLQETVRGIAGYENFQVIATPGNHDLYNDSGALYSQDGGKKSISDGLGAKEFALIFAGLGYPDANLDGSDGAIKLTDWLPESYWSSSYTGGYIPSKNATNFKINYYFDKLNQVAAASTSDEKLALYSQVDDSNNVLTFTVEFTDADMKGYSFLIVDASDRVVEDVGAPVRIGEYEFNAKYADNAAAFAKEKFYKQNEAGEIDQTPITMDEAKATLSAGKNLYIDSKLCHLTGGRITQNCLEWLNEYTKTQVGDKTTLGEETYIASFHHNVLPHFEQEDDILKDFTLYNWEYAAKRFLDMGVRYTLTGHMHSSDVMQYTDPEGRTLYDMETGSSVSYGSPRRYMTVTRHNIDGALGETFGTNIYELQNLKELASDDVYNPDNAWDQTAYDAAIAAYNANKTEENWQAIFDANPNYYVYTLKYAEMSILSYNEYSNGDIYSILLERVVNHFLNENMINSLKGTLSGFIKGLGSSSGLVSTALSLVGGVDVLDGLAMYLIDTILYDLYPNGKYPYTVGGTTTYYDNGLDYVLAIVNCVLDLEYGDATIQSSVNTDNKGKLPLREAAAFIMLSHADGTEVALATPDTIDSMFAEIDAKFQEVDYSQNPLPLDKDGNQRAEYRYKNPLDKTYRKRMVAALMDIHRQALNGDLAKTLFNSLLDPLYNQDNSLLKTLFTKSFDFSQSTVKINPATNKPYVAQKVYENLNKNIGQLGGILLQALGSKGNLTIDLNNLVLNDIVNQILPLLKSMLGDMLGFNLVGDTLFECVDTFLESYLTDSFYIGLGGIADAIVVAYATDVRPDLADITDSTQVLTLQPHAAYTYGGTPVTYVSALDKSLNSSRVTKDSFNAATQDNGRVPSRVTANFDTQEKTDSVSGTTSYTFKFYTEENVYGSFKWKATENGTFNTLSTSPVGATVVDGYLQSTASATVSGVTVKMTSVTKPQYVPLIDLGLACLSHGEVTYEETVKNEKVEKPYLYGQRADGSYWRDAAPKNSVIYWNVHTVTVTGLNPNTTYFYDLAGIYLASDGSVLEFSLADYSKEVNGYAKDSFTFKTAATSSVDEFEFLTIADIQGMIKSMYTNSYKAVEKILQDERTQNFDFMLNAGDMCDNGKNFYQWGWALDTYLPLFANTSHFFTAGNHESSSTALTDYFNYTLPRNKTGALYQSDKDNFKGGVFYSFDYANAHFTVLNTNDTDDKGLGAQQLAWLKADLKASKAKWKFVLMHKSLFSGGSHSSDGEVIAMRKQLVPIFAQNGVNIVFAGHDHTYTTTHLINSKNAIIDYSNANGEQFAGSGVMYVTLGTMGTKFYTYGENDATTPKFDEDQSILNTLDSQTFGKVSVKGGKLTYSGYYYDAAADRIVQKSSIVLTDDANIALDAMKAANANPQIFTVALNGANDLTSLIDESYLPAGYKISYSVGDATFEKASDITFKGGSASVDVMLLDAKGNQVGKITTVKISKDKYGMTLGLGISIPVIVIVGAAVAAVLIILKKKGKLGKKSA